MMLNITRQLHQMKKHLVPTIPEEESTPVVRALVAMCNGHPLGLRFAFFPKILDHYSEMNAT
jgi:hypothetical protein